MKYDVRFSCGHTHTVELFGKSADRERKIKWYEEFGVCPDCYAEQKRIEMTVAAEKQGLATSCRHKASIDFFSRIGIMKPVGCAVGREKAR